MEQRFGDEAVILYRDAGDEAVRSEHADLIASFEANGYLYPITVVDGTPLYDGAVSYPGIMRAVHDRLSEPVGGR